MTHARVKAPGTRVPGTFRFPILNYHGIQPHDGQYEWTDGEEVYVLSIAPFKKQLEHLATTGRETLSLNQLDEWLQGKGTQKKPIVLTFDDGHVSHFEHAAPALKEAHFTGIFFIPAALIGRKGQMSWAQLRELVQDGFEIGSHGLRHIPLTNLSSGELKEEINLSKEILQDRLGIEVKSFSLPRGFYHSRIAEEAAEAGYRFLFTSRFELVRKGDDLLDLARLAVKRGFSPENFSRWVEGDLGAMKYSERLKEWTRRLVPPSIYTGLAELIMRGRAV